MFHPKEVQNVVSAIKIQMNVCFSVAKTLVPVEDILDMHNVDNKMTDSVRYNAGIWCHYIAWDIKNRLYNLNKVNNNFAWMKCFTQGCHNMEKLVLKK